MGGNYEKGLYNQLMEVMARLDAVEEDLHVEKIEHKNDVDRLNAKIDCLTEENRLLKDDNARLKSIINNDSSNTSLPPFTDQKGGKPANTYNSCQHTGRKAGGQKGHKGTTLTKEEVEEKIAKACERAGRAREEVTLIAVSKTKPIEMLQEIYDEGIRDFGENKVQELTEKYEVMPKDMKWHMIGHLQRNKVKYIVDKVTLIHSVDSLRLLSLIHI